MYRLMHCVLWLIWCNDTYHIVLQIAINCNGKFNLFLSIQNTESELIFINTKYWKVNLFLSSVWNTGKWTYFTFFIFSFAAERLCDNTHWTSFYDLFYCRASGHRHSSRAFGLYLLLHLDFHPLLPPLPLSPYRDPSFGPQILIQGKFDPGDLGPTGQLSGTNCPGSMWWIEYLISRNLFMLVC